MAQSCVTHGQAASVSKLCRDRTKEITDVCRHRVLIKDKNKRRNDAAETALIEQHTKELIQCENIITVNYIVHFANDPLYTPRVYNKHTQFTIQ